MVTMTMMYGTYMLSSLGIGVELFMIVILIFKFLL